MILITGPESTGKSTLAQQLSEHTGREWMPEYGRTYLEEHGPHYTYDDIEIMALRHAEQVLAARDNELILDTYLLNYKIWSEYRYDKVSPEIIRLMSECSFDHVLLMRPDVPWEYGPYRENPDDRGVLFDIYVKEMAVLGWAYTIVDGIGDERFENALEAINNGSL